MDRNLASAIAFASTATLAVLLAAASSGSAYADDITIDTTPSPAANARAGQPNVFRRGAPVRVDSSEWALQSNQPAALKSASTRSELQAEYKASREHVNALLGEDSGSAYFMKSPGRSNGTATMGAPSR